MNTNFSRIIQLFICGLVYCGVCSQVGRMLADGAYQDFTRFGIPALILSGLMCLVAWRGNL